MNISKIRAEKASAQLLLHTTAIMIWMINEGAFLARTKAES